MAQCHACLWDCCQIDKQLFGGTCPLSMPKGWLSASLGAGALLVSSSH